MNKNEQEASSNRDISRRNFVANAALIGAGLAVAPLLGCNSERPAPLATQKPDTQKPDARKPDARKLGTRKLGPLEVSALGHGCMSISANYGPPADRSQGINVIRRA